MNQMTCVTFVVAMAAITALLFEVWKGNMDTGTLLTSGRAMTSKGSASEPFNIDWNSVGDGDYYTVCYKGKTNGHLWTTAPHSAL